MRRPPRGVVRAGAVALAAVSAAGGFGAGRGWREGSAAGSEPAPERSGETTPTHAGPVGRGEPRHALLALADGCDGFKGSLAPGLTPRQVVMGSGSDPRSGDTLPVASVSMAADMGSSGKILDSAPFSVTVALLAPGAEPGRGALLADRIGAVQLWAFWDGDDLHKAVRTWDGSRWGMAADDDAGDLTAVGGRRAMSFYWAGLGDGARYGAFVATAAGCAAEGLDAKQRPALSP